jgi:hypothetical protein
MDMKRVDVRCGSSASFDGRSVLVCLTPDRYRESGRAGTPASCQSLTIRNATAMSSNLEPYMIMTKKPKPFSAACFTAAMNCTSRP